MCTEICDKTLGPRSCAKICLVYVYPANCPDKAERMYAVLDDQSNRSLVKSEFFNLFGITGDSSLYTLKTCSGIKEKAGKKASNFIVASLDGKTNVALPPLLECNMMPDDRSEIPTPDITQYFPHLAPVADKIPPPDPSAPILSTNYASSTMVRITHHTRIGFRLGNCGRGLPWRSSQANQCECLQDKCAAKWTHLISHAL